MKLLFVFGTRPEAIKMAPVILQARAQPHWQVRVCVTGQHREMLMPVLALFDIQPDIQLDVMRAGQTLTALTCALLSACESLYASEQPDLVLVHGDTTTTFAASLAAYYARCTVAHVEAGLRTHQRYAPWPEEMNRRLTGALAEWHFAPTPQARDNLLGEGIAAEAIHITGNTVIDALTYSVQRLRSDAELQARMRAHFDFLDPSRRLLLVTGHRRENFGPGFEGICSALQQLGAREDLQIVYPVHLNPQVQEPVQRLLAGDARIHLLAPQDYLPFVYLLDRAHLVLTDSGGIQEEAPTLGKPVLVMRETTERPEAVSAGTARLVGTDPARIVAETARLLDDAALYAHMAQAHNPYGDGHAAQRIVQALLQHTPSRSVA